MRVSQPIPVTLPRHGVLFAESSHAAGFRMAARTDPYHKLIYVLSGRIAYWETTLSSTLTAPTEAASGAVLIVPAGTPHHFDDQEPSTLLLLCLRTELPLADPDLATLWSKLCRIPEHRLMLPRPARQRLEAMWRRAMFEWDHATLGGSVTVRALAAQTLVLLARVPADETGATAIERVAAVQREIQETFFDQWDLDRAAARAGLSRRRFSDLFRTATAQTFGNFLLEQRLNHAAKLLRGGEHSVMGVMFSCGFNDVSHFYRMFKQRFGAAPRTWLAEPKLSARAKAGARAQTRPQ